MFREKYDCIEKKTRKQSIKFPRYISNGSRRIPFDRVAFKPAIPI